MEHFLGHLLAQTHGALSYGLVFLVLVLCGMGLPMPEDVTLILAGYLSYAKAVRTDLMLVICFFGILAGDTSMFFIGRRIGRNPRPGSWIARLVTREKLAKVEQLFARWGEKIVLAARFMPGVRAGVYFAAGASGIAYSHFILFDCLAACVSVPTLMLLAKHFGGELTHFIMMARRAQMTIAVVLAASVAAYVLIQRTRQKREREGMQPAGGGDGTPTPPPMEPPKSASDAVAERTTH